jgi:hypothetical protein
MQGEKTVAKKTSKTYVSALDADLAAAKLSREVYLTVYLNTESFLLDEIGSNLAYLMGAIVTNQQYETERPLIPFVKLLKKHFDKNHEVWKYIKIVNYDGNVK